jgi:hypothetical protein
MGLINDVVASFRGDTRQAGGSQPRAEENGMTIRTISVELEPGGPVVLAEVYGVETDVGDAHGRVADPREVLDASRRSVREAIDNLVVPSARLFVEGLRELQPSAVEVQFGLKLSGKAGLLFASSTTEGSISVKLTWGTTTPAEPAKESGADDDATPPDEVLAR